MALDATDVKILNMLINNGRVSYSDIAKEVGMKPPSVIDRIKKMESDGVIYDYCAKVNYKKLGLDLVAFIGVTVDNPEHIDSFGTTIKDMDEDIVECYHVTGDWTLLIKIITKNTSTLAAIIKKIRSFPGVVNTNTILVFSTMLDKVHGV